VALVVDREGVIRAWDGDCAEVFGYSEEEALGKTLDLVVPPPLQKLHWRGFNRAVATGKLKRPGKTLRVPAVQKGGKLVSLQLEDTELVRGSDARVAQVAVSPSRGPRWISALSRPLLAVMSLGRRPSS
jgi:PAS domain S-box-containing protein